jgi:hypothetical protein
MFLHQTFYNTLTTTEISKEITPSSITIHTQVYKRTQNCMQEVEDYFFGCIYRYTFSYTETFCKWFLFCAGPTFITSFLTLSFHLCPSITNGLLPQALQMKIFLFCLNTHVHQVMKVKKQCSYTVKPSYSATVCLP